jgi:acetylornithine deacetylase
VNQYAQLLADLVSINSVNPSLVAGGPGEAQIAGYVARWLERAGLDVSLDQAAPGRLSVIGVARGAGRGRSLMLNAHLDTVGVAGMSDPHRPRIENNRLYGRGAFDMKGSLTSILLAGARAAQMKLAGDVILTCVADEEYASIGTASVLKRFSADAAIVTEPTGLDICVAHKGFAWFDIQTDGVAAHGSRPDLGVDAIARMGPVITAVAELDRRLRAGPPHPLLGTGSIHCSLVSGGQELSSYPARCLLQVERRTVPGESPEQVSSQVQAIAPATMTLWRDPFEIEESAEIVQLLRRKLPRARIYGETFWMDAALTAAAGIPTAVFGPGGGGAHAAIEYSNLDEVARATDVLLAVASEWCAPG